MDEDLAAAHARPLTGIDAAELAPRRTADHERAAAHRRSGPIAGVPLDVELAASHSRPGVHATERGVVFCRFPLVGRAENQRIET